MACRYTASGYENADLCAWTFSSNTFAQGGGLANLRWTCPAAAAKAGCTSRYYLIQVMVCLTQTRKQRRLITCCPTLWACSHHMFELASHHLWCT